MCVAHVYVVCLPQHEKEKEDELKMAITYARQADFEQNNRLIWERHPPIGPWGTQRPRLGARLMVRNQLKRLLPAIVAELSDWKENSRVKTAKMLRTLLVYAEEVTTGSLNVILSMLARSLHQQDAMTQSILIDCALLIGRFTHPNAFVIQLIEEEEAHLHEFPEWRPSRLRVLAETIRGTTASRLLPHVESILDSLARFEHIESASPGINLHLARVLHALIENIGEHACAHIDQILRLLIVAYSRKLGEPFEEPWLPVAEAALRAMHALATICGGTDVAALLATRFEKLLVLIMGDSSSGGAEWAPSLALAGLVHATTLPLGMFSMLVDVIRDALRSELVTIVHFALKELERLLALVTTNASSCDPALLDILQSKLSALVSSALIPCASQFKDQVCASSMQSSSVQSVWEALPLSLL